MKEEIFKSDLSRLITLSESHSSHYIAEIARDISWRYLWDLALDRGIQGTHQLQRIIYLLSRPIFNRTYCPTCCVYITPPETWVNHVCDNHPPVTRDTSTPISLRNIIEALKHGDAEFIFNLLLH